jgi:HEAT repeat protein
MGYFMDLTEAFVYYRMAEAIPALIRLAENSHWPSAILPAISEIGGPTAVNFLRSRLGLPAPNDSPEYRPSVEIGLARNGERQRLKRCVEFLRSDNWGVPHAAVRALKACLPFDGPDFSKEEGAPPPQTSQNIVYITWDNWLRKYGNRLQWDSATRRYLLR